jgi:hypothetical protein
MAAMILTSIGIPRLLPSRGTSLLSTMRPNFGLAIGTHVADFIEKDCALIGCLQFPAAAGIRSSEC